MDFKIVAHTPVGVFTSVVVENASEEAYSYIVDNIRESDKFVHFNDADGNLVIIKEDVLNASVFTICKIKE